MRRICPCFTLSRIKCVVIQDLADDFEQLQRLTSAAGLVLLSRYFDGTCDSNK